MIAAPKSLEQIGDLEPAHRIGVRDVIAMHVVMSHNNQRLFRVIWSILRDRPDHASPSTARLSASVKTRAVCATCRRHR